jgi:hypothetical protein
MDDFSYPGLVNSFGVPPSPANFPRPLKRKAASVFELHLRNNTIHFPKTGLLFPGNPSVKIRYEIVYVYGLGCSIMSL